MNAPLAVLVGLCAVLVAVDLVFGGLGLTGVVALVAGLAVMLLGRAIAPMLRRSEDYYDR